MTDLFKDGFKPTDFHFDIESVVKGISSTQMADRANALLKDALEKAPKVYQPANLPEHLRAWFLRKMSGPGHIARLVDVREIGE